MFSSVALCSTILCVKAGCDADPSVVSKVTFGADIVIGLALLIIGCLSISGVMPCSAIGGGFMIGLGCLNLILTTLITERNCNIISIWDAS
jgi:hypothetical protein